ncbi:MAG: hypothetical protein IJ632_01080 [Muribaculaceae bacterium]|nr:hypothetical protein [Muribaculaceae bacterium]
MGLFKDIINMASGAVGGQMTGGFPGQQQFPGQQYPGQQQQGLPMGGIAGGVAGAVLGGMMTKGVGGALGGALGGAVLGNVLGKLGGQAQQQAIGQQQQGLMGQPGYPQQQAYGAYPQQQGYPQQQPMSNMAAGVMSVIGMAQSALPGQQRY